MTERPTEQTQSRLTGLDAPAPEASAGTRTSAPSAPTLPPMPPRRRPGADPPRRTPPAEAELGAAGRPRSTGPTAPTGPCPPTAPRPSRRHRIPLPAPRRRPRRSPRRRPRPCCRRPCVHQEQAQPAPRQRTRATRAAKAKPRRTRRARLRLTRIDPWSVMKTAFLLSIAFGVVTVVAVADGLVGARRRRRLGLHQPDGPATSSATSPTRRSTSRTTSGSTGSWASRCWSR